MRNRFNLLVILLLALLLGSCERKYQAPGSEVSKICVKVPIEYTQVNEVVTFGDLSTGVTSREWSFPEHITDIQNSDNNVQSRESIVSVSFSEPGTHTIYLHLEFNEPLQENTANRGATSIDTALTITVYDFVEAAFTANYISINGLDSSRLNISNQAANTIWAGEFIRFTSTQKGSPSSYSWHFPGGIPEYYTGHDSSILVQYLNFGKHEVWHQASRILPRGSDSLKLADFIEVVRSPRKTRLIEALKLESRSIQLQFSSYIIEPNNVSQAFSLTVRNNQRIIPVTITNTVVDPLEKYKVNLTLNAPIYDDDSVFINYTSEVLVDYSSNLVPLFTNIYVNPNMYSPLPAAMDAGFEESPTSWYDASWAGSFWAQNHYQYTISETQVHSGRKALKFQVFPNGGAPLRAPVSYSIEPGASYLVSFWMFIENPGEAGVGNNIGLYNGDWVNYQSNPVIYLDGVGINQWKYCYRVLAPVPENPNNLVPVLRGVNYGINQPVIVYIDDISIQKFNIRP